MTMFYALLFSTLMLCLVEVVDLSRFERKVCEKLNVWMKGWMVRKEEKIYKSL